MFGNGNQLRKLGILLSAVRLCVTPASQWPCSSIATLPLASRPAELPAPVCAGVARNPSLNGFASSSFFRYSPALTQHWSLKLCETIVFWTTVLLQILTASVCQETASGPLSCPPTESGVMPAAFSFAMSAMNAVQFVGPPLMPAFLK